jgi:hypothetical protein
MQITREEVLAALDYDRDTGSFKWKRRGKGVTVGTIAGSIGSNGYRQIVINKNRYPLHHIVWLVEHGEMPPSMIDHINGAPTDNRISNLRVTNNTMNQWNQKMHRDNTSGVKGVHRNKGKWLARISVEGRRITLGRFEAIEEAEGVIKAAREHYHGDYSRHA